MKKAPERSSLLDLLWVRAVLALWIIGVVGYYGRVQLAHFLGLTTP